MFIGLEEHYPCLAWQAYLVDIETIIAFIEHLKQVHLQVVEERLVEVVDHPEEEVQHLEEVAHQLVVVAVRLLEVEEVLNLVAVGEEVVQPLVGEVEVRLRLRGHQSFTPSEQHTHQPATFVAHFTPATLALPFCH